MIFNKLANLLTILSTVTTSGLLYLLEPKISMLKAATLTLLWAVMGVSRLRRLPAFRLTPTAS